MLVDRPHGDGLGKHRSFAFSESGGDQSRFRSCDAEHDARHEMVRVGGS